MTASQNTRTFLGRILFHISYKVLSRIQITGMKGKDATKKAPIDIALTKADGPTYHSRLDG